MAIGPSAISYKLNSWLINFGAITLLHCRSIRGLLRPNHIFILSKHLGRREYNHNGKELRYVESLNSAANETKSCHSVISVIPISDIRWLEDRRKCFTGCCLSPGTTTSPDPTFSKGAVWVVFLRHHAWWHFQFLLRCLLVPGAWHDALFGERVGFGMGLLFRKLP